MYHFKNEKELRDFIAKEVLVTSEVVEELGITRQGLGDLVARGKLEPIKETKSTKLFLRSEIMERKQKT